jgi:putative phosphoesterase
MKIGVFSDTHDNLPTMQKIVEIFNQAGVEHVIHCGDVVAPFAFRVLEKLKAKITAIFGNNDGEHLGLKEMFAKLGSIADPPREVTFGDKKIIMNHFFSDSHYEALALSGKYDIILFGHTHQLLNKKIGNAIVLNPGEGCGYLTGKCTCAIVDTDKMSVEIREVKP